MTDHHAVPTRADDIFCKSWNIKCCFFLLSHSLFSISPNPRGVQKDFPKTLWQREVSNSMGEFYQREVIHSKGFKHLWATGSHHFSIIWIRYVLVSFRLTVITNRSKFVLAQHNRNVYCVIMEQSSEVAREVCVGVQGFLCPVIHVKLIILPSWTCVFHCHSGGCHHSQPEEDRG